MSLRDADDRVSHIFSNANFAVRCAEGCERHESICDREQPDTIWQEAHRRGGNRFAEAEHPFTAGHMWNAFQLPLRIPLAYNSLLSSFLIEHFG